MSEHKRKSFTLIELLVVIAIIGILAGLVTASLNSARAKARDAKRLADLREIHTALKMYELDHGYLPSPEWDKYGKNQDGVLTNGKDDGSWDLSSDSKTGVPFMQFLVDGGYFKKVPVDPINDGVGDVTKQGSTGGKGYGYYYFCYTKGWGNNANKVTLGATIENRRYVEKATGAKNDDFYKQTGASKNSPFSYSMFNLEPGHTCRGN